MKKTKQRKLYLLLALCLVLGLLACCKIGDALAWLKQEQKLSNEFFAPVVDIEFVDPNVSVYTIQNKSNTQVYVRAEVIGSIKDTDGAILSSLEADAYDLVQVAEDAKWEKGADGYFYYLTPLEVDEKITIKVTADADYAVDVYAQAVMPTDVQNAWNASVDANGQILPPTDVAQSILWEEEGEK